MNDTNHIAQDTNVGAAIAFAERTTKPEIMHVDVPWSDLAEDVIVTRDRTGDTCLTTARDLLAAYAPAPDRRKGTIETHALDSFVALVNRDKRPDSVIFADTPRRTLTAVFDFHGPADSAPRWGQDRATYGFAFSSQFRAWIDLSGRALSQKDFARLIDDRLTDLGDGRSVGEIAAEFAKRRGVMFATIPDLLVFTRTIAAKSTVESEERIDEATGDVSIQFKKKNDVKTPDGQPVSVPAAFVLDIPVLNGPGATKFSIPVRLKYDIPEKGSIQWTIDLHATERFIEAAIAECVEQIGKPAPDGCGLPVYLARAPE